MQILIIARVLTGRLPLQVVLQEQAREQVMPGMPVIAKVQVMEMYLIILIPVMVRIQLSFH